jgi:hypothetical protein
VYERRMADAVRRIRLICLALLAAVFVISWALLYGHLPLAGGVAVALLITAVAWIPVAIVPSANTETALRHWITVEHFPPNEAYFKLAAKRGAAGDHDEQIWLLRKIADRGDREAYRLLLTVLTEHGAPDDVAALRRRTFAYPGVRPQDPLCTPWPGIDGPGLLAATEERIHRDSDAALRSRAALLDAAGRPDPAVWQALVDAGVSGFHLPLARHLAGTGRLTEAVGLMRTGAAGELPNFRDTADFLREHDLLGELEEDARQVWERDRDARALTELRQLFTDQNRLDELARLPRSAPSVSHGNSSAAQWLGVSPPPSYDAGFPGGYTGYTGGGNGC